MRARRAVERLIESYQEELISLDELRARSPGLRKREATLQAELDALDAELHDAESYLKLTETLESFRARLGANAQQLTIEQRQQVPDGYVLRDCACLPRSSLGARYAL